MKRNQELVAAAVVVGAPVPANPPPPPGGGRWLWGGDEWVSTDPKPVAADVQPSTQSVTE